MSHDHCHHHGIGGHGHHATDNYGAAFFVGTLLNLGYIACEAWYGFKSNSVALLADASHNAGDVLSLIVAWSAFTLSKTKPSPRYTYGLRSSSIIAALTNSLFLLVVIGGIAWESASRFLNHHAPLQGTTVIYVAAGGVLINGVTAWLFSAGQSHDLNLRGVFQHMLADAVISFGVVISGVLFLTTGYAWIDPLTSILIVILISLGTVKMLRKSLRLALQAVPEGINHEEVLRFLQSQEGVTTLHDLHIWAMSTTDNALSAHLVMPSGHPGDAFLYQLSQKLEQQFRINHATFQIELGNTGQECKLAPDHII